MKYHEDHFEEYMNNNQRFELHPECNKIMSCLPDQLKKLPNLILYGPSGVGKYTQSLKIINKYSTSKLKYEKKMYINFNKQEFFYKISDIHYEIDMSLLGCNSKLLWHDLYQQIVDSIIAKTNRYAIILCKNFHDIHTELLENFYSYMQQNNFSVNIKFILITKEVSFLPDNIINCCKLLNIGRPTKKNYNLCIKNSTKINNQFIHNIKYLNNYNKLISVPYQLICDDILNNIKNLEQLNFLKFRDLLYDILIYDLDLNNCIWYILNSLINEKVITNEQVFSKILLHTFSFLNYYNNNYRPIYHLEKYFLFIAKHINGY